MNPSARAGVVEKGKKRPFTEAEAMLYDAGYRAFTDMRSWRRAFYLMVVANLVLVWTMWMN